MKTIKQVLSKRIFRFVLIVTFNFFIVAFGIMYFMTSNSLDQSTMQASMGYNKSVENAIENFKIKAELIAQNDEITDMSTPLEQRKKVLEKLSKENGFIDISVSDANGKTYNGTDISDRDYFKGAMNAETYISSPVIRKTDSSIILFVATKIHNKSGYNGIIYAALSSDQFSKMVQDIKIGNKGYAFIVDKTGTIIAHPNQELVNKFENYINKAKEDDSYKKVGSVFEDVLASKEGSARVKLEGQNDQMHFINIEGTDGWKLCVNASVNEGMFWLYIFIGLAITFFIANGLISLRVAKSIAYKISDPIEKLTERIESLAVGDIHTEVPEIKTGDELEIVADSLQSTINSLNSYIGNIDSVLNSISKGNLEIEINQEYSGDFVSIKDSLNQIIKSLNEIFYEIQESSELVASSSEEMSSTTQSLSEGSTEQAGVVEELLASFNEVSEKVVRNSKNAESAKDLFQESKSIVNEGNEKMLNLIQAMDEINEASHKIVDITQSIEDIAAQTNLLALNAAIEAARAGEAGKGFAVVAEEVRQLAEQSTQAVQNTNEIIGASISAAKTSSVIAGETAESLKKIVKYVDDVSIMIENIAEASKEQAEAITQMTGGVEQISEVVQTNSATAEEIAATTEELASQAQVLEGEIGKFNLKG